MSKLLKIFEWRKFSMPLVGILFHVLKLLPFRNKDLWVFGCWTGKKYDDNAKFLFEHVNKKHSEIRCVWLTRNPAVVKQVNALGYEAYMWNSFKGIVLEEDYEKISQIINRQQFESPQNTEKIDYVRYRIRCKNGAIKEVDDYGHLVYDKNYGMVYYVFLVDIQYLNKISL